MHEKFGLFSYDLNKFMEKKLWTITIVCDRYVLRYKFWVLISLAQSLKYPYKPINYFGPTQIFATYFPHITQLGLPQIFPI